MIEPSTLETLRSIDRALATAGMRYAVIGARVLDLRFEELGSPKNLLAETKDVDFIVLVDSWDRFGEAVGGLSGFEPTDVEHRMTSPHGVLVDIVPCGAGIESEGRITWPKSERVMNVIGLREALQSATAVEVEPGLAIPTATIPGFVLCKIAAYLDRRPAWPKDLRHILVCLEHWASDPGDERRYEAVGQAVDGVEVEWNEAGAWITGRGIRAIASPPALQQAASFFESAADPYSREVGASCRPYDEESDRERVARLFRVAWAATSR